MKRVFNYLAVAASAILVLSACTSDKLEAYSGQPDTNPESPDNAITFGTYVGKSGVTRAGATNAMTTTQLQSTGFGVFAYYTGTSTYGQAQKTTYSAEEGSGTNIVANFMYNQKVTFTDPNWLYSPIKYWPNEVGTNVDDQDNDTGGDPATSTNSNGGKVSFFAYAPYVYVTTSASAKDKDNSAVTVGKEKSNTDESSYEKVASGETQAGTNGVGITNITANSNAGDPKITYKLASNGNNVDLLWGTLDATTTGKNVLGTDNVGVEGSSSATANTYKQAILNDYTVGADLTKQKVEGKVSFAFKHALAKVGGATMTSTPGTVSDKSGLLVQLDIDKDGSEIGGDKDPNTVVTIESITIKNCEVEYDSNDDGTPDATGWVTGGVFNLATGKWTGLTTGSESDAVTQTIKRDDAVPAGNAKLNADIAEPASVTSMTKPEGSSDYKVNGTVPGVLTTKKAVYKEDASPFVFIPGTKPSFTVEVTYIVRTFDPNLASSANDDTGTGSPKVSTWSKVKQTIKKKVTFNDVVQLNKQYTLIMHLGLTSVKFEATVSNWELRGDDNNNGVIDEEETAVDITDVYLPINVQEESAAVNVTAGKNAAVSTSPATTSYEITFSESTSLNAYGVFTDAACGTSAGTGYNAVVGTGTDANKVTVTLPANTSSKNNVVYVKVTDSSKGTSVITITQHAANISLTASGSVTAGTEGTITLDVKDNATTPASIDLTATGNTSSIKVYNESDTEQSWTVTKTSTGATITVPSSATAGTYTARVKVNDAPMATTTFVVAAP